jgi:hypothetical protein
LALRRSSGHGLDLQPRQRNRGNGDGGRGH